MIDFIKAFIFVITSIVMGVTILLVPDSSGAVSITYIGVLGIYLGLDVAEMISSTAKMKKGEYKNLKTHKYIISVICLAVLLVMCLIKKDNNITTAITTFISAIMVVSGCLLGGLEGNKIATQCDGEKNE